MRLERACIIALEVEGFREARARLGDGPLCIEWIRGVLPDDPRALSLSTSFGRALCPAKTRGVAAAHLLLARKLAQELRDDEVSLVLEEDAVPLCSQQDCLSRVAAEACSVGPPAWGVLLLHWLGFACQPYSMAAYALARSGAFAQAAMAVQWHLDVQRHSSSRLALRVLRPPCFTTLDGPGPGDLSILGQTPRFLLTQPFAGRLRAGHAVAGALLLLVLIVLSAKAGVVTLAAGLLIGTALALPVSVGLPLSTPFAFAPPAAVGSAMAALTVQRPGAAGLLLGFGTTAALLILDRNSRDEEL